MAHSSWAINLESSPPALHNLAFSSPISSPPRKFFSQPAKKTKQKPSTPFFLSRSETQPYSHQFFTMFESANYIFAASFSPLEVPVPKPLLHRFTGAVIPPAYTGFPFEVGALYEAVDFYSKKPLTTGKPRTNSSSEPFSSPHFLPQFIYNQQYRLSKVHGPQLLLERPSSNPDLREEADPTTDTLSQCGSRSSASPRSFATN